MQFDLSAHTLIGSAGDLAVAQEDDEILLKLAMLIEGECEGLGATAAAAKYGYTLDEGEPACTTSHSEG